MHFNRSPDSWPAFLIGLIMLFYWLRVMQMVARTRQTVGRAANFIPPEPLGRLLRIVWVPVVLLWVFLPLLTPFLANRPWILAPLAAVYAHPLIAWPAFTVALAAMYGTWICWQRMGTSWRMGIDPNERTQLVCSGPYAYIRHPIYALSSVLMVCCIIAVASPLMILVGLLHLLLLQWEARREEKFLTALHGPAYTNYAARAGRFVPRVFSSGANR